MSIYSTNHPKCEAEKKAAGLTISAAEKDLGGFSVRRVLPAARRRMVGPFIFFDHIGPAEFPPGKGINVRPHPHIGLATITYLFAGQMLHQDSTGAIQTIRPGAVNLMTAGRGVVHSERAGDDIDTQSTLHALQTWIALPDDKEDMEPGFVHIPESDLPEAGTGSISARVIMGSAFGEISPVPTHSPTLYVEVRLSAGESCALPTNYPELAIYPIFGDISYGDCRIEPNTMFVPQALDESITGQSDAHFVIIGGEPVGSRHVWWNFVSSSKDKIEAAKLAWHNRRFDDIPGDAEEWIPLPEGSL